MTVSAQCLVTQWKALPPLDKEQKFLWVQKRLDKCMKEKSTDS